MRVHGTGAWGSRAVGGDGAKHTTGESRSPCCLVIGISKDLRQALEYGLDGGEIAEEADLTSLRGDPEFESIVADVSKRNVGEE